MLTRTEAGGWAAGSSRSWKVLTTVAHQSHIRHASVGTSIGAYVSETVGTAVGTVVSAAVGAAVGASAGASAGAVVGATVGPAHLPSRIHQADSHSDRHTPVAHGLAVSQRSPDGHRSHQDSRQNECMRHDRTGMGSALTSV